MKRVLIGGMHHESNSFNPIVAGENDFSVIYGGDIFDNIRDNDSTSGIITTLREAGCEVIPTVFARAVPNGEVDYKFYMKIKDEIIKRAIKANEEKALDAITLALHGSMRVKDLGEAEGVLLEELRSLFPNIPLYSSLDMHATMTKKMHHNCNGFVGYKCAPHTDCTETGIHAAEMTLKSLNHSLIGRSAWVKVPILIAGEQSSTSTEPMISLIHELRKIEEQEGVLAASILMGFPWADSEDGSIGVYIVTENNQELADKLAIEFAELIWSKRNQFEFHTETYENVEALDKSFKGIEEGKTPIYLSDSGDNPTAGASSDNTEFLKLIIRDKRTMFLEHPIIYGGFYDPEATKQCEGKVGSEITLTFGSKFDPTNSTSVTATGIVKSYIKNWGMNNLPKGDLALFSTGGVDIVLAEQHVGYTDPKMFEDLGLNPSEVEIIVCKLGYLTPGHEALAKRSIMALTKGNTNENLRSIEYKLLKRPIFPLDEEFEYKAADNLIR